MKVVLSIAGSDSGAGAGIQADLKTLSALGVYGTTAITAVTSQNTVGVRHIEALSAEVVRSQIDAVCDDFHVAAVKIGMVSNERIIRAIGDALRQHAIDLVVLDPILAAGSGDALLDASAMEALQSELFPLTTVLTPNVPEAAAILGRTLVDADTALFAAANELRAMGPRSVLLKGGHRLGDCVDLFVDAKGEHALHAQRIDGKLVHGTGCTLSSAIAAFLARGFEPLEASKAAKAFISRAIDDAISLGKGQWNLRHRCEPDH